MKQKIKKALIIVLIAAVLTLLSIGIYGLLLNIAEASNYFNAILIAFAMIQFTLITGFFVILYKIRK